MNYLLSMICCEVLAPSEQTTMIGNFDSLMILSDTIELFTKDFFFADYFLILAKILQTKT